MVRRVNVLSSRRLLWPVLFLSLCGLTANAQSTDLLRLNLAKGRHFIVAPSFSLSVNPTGVAVGDLNRDGKPDLVVTEKGSGSVTVFLGAGNGAFAPGVAYPAGTQPGNALLADLNGDGKLDLVVTDGATGAIDVLFGNGDGTFGSPTSYAAIQNPVGIALGNFTGKGKIDLAVASPTGLAVLLNDGTGHFAPAPSLYIPSQPVSLTAADLRGAGHDDLILANQDGTVSVLLGGGAGHFTPLPAQTVNSGPLSSIAAGDFNVDGKLDLAVTQAGSNTVTVLLGRGDGTFQAGQSYTVGNGPTSVRVADLNGDGFADLVTVNQAANTFSVLLGNGDGTFKPSVDFVAGNLPLEAVVADFNGDGHPDLAIANYQDSTLSVALGHGDGTFIAARDYKGGLQSKAVASGDLNGDGLPDLVVVNSCGSDPTCTSHGSATVFLANQNGTYRPASTIPLGSGPVAVALADLNGDKKLDLIALNRNDKTMAVMLGNGDGTFGQPQLYTVSGNPRALLVGDFNGDGHPDVAVASDCGQTTCTQPGNLDIWLGRGDGSLAASATYTLGYSPVSIAAGDLYGTGHLDLVVANACGDDSTCKSDGTATLLTGDGTGKFTQAGEIDLGKAPSAIALGNLSGSGLDLAVALRASNKVAVMHANGSGGFGAPVTYPVGSAPSALAIADFNGDGLMDLAVANFQSSTVSVLNGTGAGTLQPAVTYAVGTGPESLAAVGTSGPASLASANGDSGATPMGTDITLLRIHTEADPPNPPAGVTVSVSPATGTVDQSEVLTAALVGAANTPPTGTVTFTSAITPSANLICAESTDNPQDNTVPSTVVSAGNGTATATCTTTSLEAGNDTITAALNSDPNFTGGSGSTTLTIDPAATSTAVASSTGGSSTVDDSVTFTATVSAPSGATVPLTGSVTFTDNGAVITNGSSCGTSGVVPIVWNLASATGTATCTTSALAAGSHAIIATYGNDTNYAASNNNVTQTVNHAGGTMTFTSSSTADTSTVNQSVTLTATITPSTGNTTVPLSGTATFTDNGGPVAGCTVSFNTSTGIATCTTSSLALGAHPLKATYSNDPSYTFSPASLTQTVNQGSTTTVISTTNTAPAVNQQVTLTATVTPNPAGNTKLSGSVTFTDTVGTTTTTICADVAVSPSTGTATCTDSWTAAGTHTINAAYANDTNFTGSDSTANPVTENVGAASTTLALASSANPSTVNQSPSVVFTATITESPVGTTGLTGTVAFTDNGAGISGCSAVTPSATNSSGMATALCTEPALTAAGSPHIIAATYAHDSNFGGSTASLSPTETVNKGATSLAVVSSQPSSAVNASVTFTATLTFPSGGVPLTGSVAFTDSVTSAAIPGCSAQAVAASTGIATCSTSTLALGSHTITASYTDSANNFQTSVNTVAQTVTAATSSITLSSSASPSTVNQTVTFTASIPVPSGSTTLTGTVAFTDNGTTICSGVRPTLVTGTNNWIAPCTDSSLSAAGSPHTIAATYSGDPNFSVNSGSLNQTVNPASTTVSLSSSQNPSVVNNSVTFTATITPNPSGAVALSGTVSFVDSVTSQVIAGCSAAGLTVSGGKTIAVCTTAALAVGGHTITATYGSDTNFTGNTATFVQTVNTATTSITVTSSTSNTSTVNQSVTFTANIPVPTGAPTPTGTVTFTDNGAPAAGAGCTDSHLTLVAGTSNWFATCTDQSLTAGTHTIVASYGGDPNLTVGNGSTTQQVSQGASLTTLISSLSPAFAAQGNAQNFEDSVTFSATVTAPPGAVVPLSNGTVAISINGTVLCSGVALSPAGVATCTAVTTAANGFTDNANGIVATYSGDPNYTASSGLFSEVVEDYNVSVAPVPTNALGVLVTQGFTTSSDPFAPSALSVTSTSFSGFTGSPTLACSGAPSGAPTCTLSSASLSIVSGVVQPSVGIVLDATNATPGTYMMTVTATDPITSIVRTANFPVTIRALSTLLTVVSGATTNNTAALTFLLPAGVNLLSFACPIIAGTGISGAEAPSGIGVACSVSPAPLGSTTSTSPQTLQATVTITTNTTIAMGPAQHTTLMLAGLFGIPVFGLIGLLRNRKTARSFLFRVLALLVLAVAAYQTMGCGGSFHTSSTQASGGTTPPGVYYLLVQGTGSDGNTYSAVLHLDVEL